MRKIDVIVLAVGILAAIGWVSYSGKDGFKGSNAMIVARSITIASTIDGQIDNQPPPVGSRVSSKQLLVHIQNNRIDRSRLVEFKSQIDYLQREIESAKGQQREVSTLLEQFKKRAKIYSRWMLSDIKLRRAVKQKRLDVAKKRSELRAREVNQAELLFRKKITSRVNVRVARTKAEIARNEVGLTEAQFQRASLLLRSLQSEGVFFENGDTSYWAKMVDTLNVRSLDNKSRIAQLEAQLVRTKLQEKVEGIRIKSSYTEEHRAPFRGIINASFVNKGSKVTSGTSLVQLLDCTQPVVIIPIPEHRIGAFSVGMKVSVYPIDSDDKLMGTIKYISSGALIGHDKTIQMQQNQLLNGNRAIVSLDHGIPDKEGKLSCETSRKAVVIIHNRSQSKGGSWLSSLLGLDPAKKEMKVSKPVSSPVVVPAGKS
ncbi:MAG: HlyD family efflux transporter periplasmic adaptor subunit [Hyphomicrobiaceae bacterium]|nr:HlyD family efflux transporter periplasmic adaptor subunit [Hyphomicrobiaceae bacterium]